MEMLDVLLAQGIRMANEPWNLDIDWWSPQHREFMKAILQRGGNANHILPSGCSPLHDAARCGEYIQVLIDDGYADVDARDLNGCTPLMVIGVESHDGTDPHRKIALLLLNTGADSLAIDNDQRGVLHHMVLNSVAYARNVSYRHVAFLELLLERGADPNLQDNSGQTPMVTLLKQSTVNAEMVKKVVKILLYVGADPFIADRDGHCVVDLLQDTEEGRVFMQQHHTFFHRN